MARLAATLPGYASVARASEVLHLAPRSVRDLIYAGRIPSLRVGRLHYIRAADLEVERRRRLGLPLPRQRRASTTGRRRRGPSSEHRPRNRSLDEALRRERATERAEMVSRWAQRHGFTEPQVPAHVREVTAPLECESCGRSIRSGRYVELVPDETQPSARLCTACGRRALLEWADRRRQEAAAARQLSQSLGEPEPPRAQQLAYSLDGPETAATAETLAALARQITPDEPQAAPTDPRAA
jgi:hypothetical protein